MNQPNVEQPTIKQNVTNEDLVECKCGSKFFFAASRIAVKVNPLVGQSPIVFTIPEGIACINCGGLLDIEKELKKKEKK